MRTSSRSSFRRPAMGVGVALTIAAVAATALLVAPVTGSSAAQGRRAPDGAHLVHTKCPQGLPPDVGKVRCDFLVVPENHSRPNGPTIRLMIARIPAASNHPAPEPTVYLNGGPGSNAIAAAGDLITEGHLNKHRELIVVTQRGTFDAHPLLSCRSIDNFRADSLDLKLYGRKTARRLDRAVNRCKRQLASKGIHRADYTTLESTEDLVDLRRVLGIQSWDVFAHSYGTDLGLTYMRLHPQGIRSVVLDGTVPPSKASIGWTWTSFKEFFSNMLKACRAQKSCKEHFPHIGRTYLKLVNVLQKHPITTKVKVPDREHRTRVKIDGGVLINWLTRQSHFTSTVPLEIHRLAHGHPRQIAKEWSLQRAVPREHRGTFGYGMGYSIWCGEWVPFQSKQKQMREGERAFPALRRSILAQGPQLTLLRRICRNWDVLKAPSSIRDVTHSSIPTLAITGTFDAQTGAQWGSYAARTLSNSTVVDLPGVAHGAFANPCGASVINSFLLRPDATDTRCVRHVHPNRFLVKPPHQGR
jgi:pimeloyl-ACP methyl ester carboxylesterase